MGSNPIVSAVSTPSFKAREVGIEPTHLVLETKILPLNYSLFKFYRYIFRFIYKKIF